MQAVDEDLIESVCERLREHLPGTEAEQAEAFVRQYYRWVAPDDLAERSALDLYGAALAHFDLARRRAPGALKVRVYNPQFERRRLAVDPHRGRDRDRRHAVPHRLRHGRAEPRAATACT